MTLALSMLSPESKAMVCRVLVILEWLRNELAVVVKKGERLAGRGEGRGWGSASHGNDDNDSSD